jgi:hypothetical protein
MPLTIEHVEQSMKGVELTPRQVRDFKTYLTAIYSLYAGEMKEIATARASAWLDIRAEKNSDKAADREWQTTEKGIREIELKWDMRRIDKLISALNTHMRVMEGESKNQW